MDFSIFLQLLISSISVGSIYAIVALALVIPFKASSILNFGQGEMVTVGAYSALILIGLGLPFFLVFFLSILIGVLFGCFIERAMIRPIMNAPEFTLVIATFAIGSMIRSAIRLYWQDNLFTMDSPFSSGSIIFSGVAINPQYLWVVFCTLCLVVFLSYLFKYTHTGKAMRSVAQSHDASRLMGIHVEKILLLSWGLSTGIGAMAGILLAPIVGINPEMGALILKALVAATIGGFTSLPGALIGGLLLGLVETFSGAIFGSSLKNVIPFMLLVLFLLLRPYGLFGKEPVSRV
jgi:branched-chain amino acid transport system permease protein